MCSQQLINKWHNGDHAYQKTLIILVLNNNITDFIIIIIIISITIILLLGFEVYNLACSV